ncbi:MAG: hemerythrin domain-containing protein [Dehalococcoidia bacterium]
MATFGNLETEVEPLASLMREHIEAHAIVTETREAIEAAFESAGDPGLVTEALERLRDLDAYLAEDLVIHIAKEEDVLFPALRGFAADTDKVVDEMVEQHDEVRNRKAILARVIVALDHTHDEVKSEHAAISNALAATTALPTADALAGLLDAVKRLDWILQGHFGDEEDDLFAPALDLLTPETFAELARQANDMDS